MKGCLVTAHRRMSSGGEKLETGGRNTEHSGSSSLSVLLPDKSSSLTHSGFSNPWCAAGPRQRPASAKARRTIADNGFALMGENKAAAEIRSAVRSRPVSAHLARGGAMASAAGASVEDYVPVKKLGQGASGSVHLAQLKEDGSHWVLKQVELGRAGSAPSSERNSAIARAERDNVLREVKLMSSIKSENLIQFCTSFLHQAPGGPQSVFIVMEYAEKGALSDYIKQLRSTASQAGEVFIWKCMLQVSAGLDAIHANRVIHRDIKSSNILITGRGDFKIADLGIAVSTSLCNVQGRMRTGKCGTLGYMAPEVSNDLPYDARADLWSLGCVLYEIACHRIPFPTGTVVDTGVRVESGISMQAITEAANMLQLSHAFSDCLNNHVLWCLAVEPSGRPTARQIISTQDSIRKAVELKVTLPEGFEFPVQASEDRIEYRGDVQGKRRGPASSSFVRGGVGDTREAWGEDDENDIGLSPIQTSPDQRQSSKLPSKRAALSSSRPQSARLGASSAALSGRLRPASASASRRAVVPTQHTMQSPTERLAGGGSAPQEPDKEPDKPEAWQTAPLSQAAKGMDALNLVDTKDEEDLPKHLRSAEQTIWERKHMYMLQALPGWHQETASAFAQDATNNKISGDEVVLRSTGGKKKKAKRLSKQDMLVAAGAQRRMTKALQSVLAPSIERGVGLSLQKIEHLLVAQVGMPIPKMLQNAGENGRACSLVDFIVSHPQEFRVGAKDEVFLANAPHIYAQNVPPNIMSARILSSILASKVGVR